MAVIRASLRLKPASDKLSEARQIFLAMVEPTRVAPGCLGCHLYQDLLEPQILLFEERWENEESLNRHVRTEQYRKVLLVMDQKPLKEIHSVQIIVVTDATDRMCLRTNGVSSLIESTASKNRFIE